MAFDVLQRILDCDTNRIINLGNPIAANDATKTDNSTAPANPASAAAAGSSYYASPADHVHQGVHGVQENGGAIAYGDVNLKDGGGIAITKSGNDFTISSVASATNKITWAEDGEKYVVGVTEEIVYEYNMNLDDCGGGSGNNIVARLSALVKASAGTATFKLYVGATAPGSTAGGTTRATFTSTSATWEKKSNAGAAFANPGGEVLVQITAVADLAGRKAYIRGIQGAIG
jgi:hypothetical protein